MHASGARGIEQIIREQAPLRENLIRRSQFVLVGEVANSLQEPALGVQEGRAELLGNAQELAPVSSLMPGATGTGMMPPSIPAQKASINASLLARNSSSRSPGRAPSFCR